MKNVKRQAGFTLIEVSMVLIIIGLLLGGVLKGQELIKNTRYRTLQSELADYVSSFSRIYSQAGLDEK